MSETLAPSFVGIRSALRELAADRLSGALHVDFNPGVRLYVMSGSVYFAEVDRQPDLGDRLVADGALTQEQLDQGSLLVQGRRHLGRLFDWTEGVDRETVMRLIGTYSSDVLSTALRLENVRVDFLENQHHRSGIVTWWNNEVLQPRSPKLATRAEPQQVAAKLEKFDAAPIAGLNLSLLSQAIDGLRRDLDDPDPLTAKNAVEVVQTHVGQARAEVGRTEPLGSRPEVNPERNLRRFAISRLIDGVRRLGKSH
jgi:hypothetical protein